jgi:hypothetical protein
MADSSSSKVAGEVDAVTVFATGVTMARAHPAALEERKSLRFIHANLSEFGVIGDNERTTARCVTLLGDQKELKAIG